MTVPRRASDGVIWVALSVRDREAMDEMQAALRLPSRADLVRTALWWYRSRHLDLPCDVNLFRLRGGQGRQKHHGRDRTRPAASVRLRRPA